MSAYFLLAALAAASMTGVLVCTRLMLRLRRPRFPQANFLVWTCVSITFLVLWFPCFLVGGQFGGAIFSWVGGYAVFFGIGLGIAIATSAPAILVAWIAIAFAMGRKEVPANV